MDKPTTRAKMTLQGIKKTQWGQQLFFGAQYDDTILDRSFQKATPNATAEFQIDNPIVLKQFGEDKIGRAYYFDISPAD